MGGPPTPGIGFGAGIERLLLSMSDAERAPEALDVFFVVEGPANTDRAALLAAMAELRRRGVTCDTDYAGRSLKGQLTQAGRLGARTTVIVDGDGARVRSAGTEERVALDELVVRLAG